MQHPRLQLLTDGERTTNVDPKLARAFAAGSIGIVDALGIDDEDILRLRRQAQALFAVRRHEHCIAILRAVIGLGEAQLEDVVLMMMCHEAIGDGASAKMWSDEVDRMAMTMDELVGRDTEVRS